VQTGAALMDAGFLSVGDGHRIQWETWGNPSRKPALFLHGGPGSGCGDTARRLFDPRAYRVVQFDQRGCGKSVPHASEPAADLSANTTGHLIEDIERLREYLGIERWLVLGGSWGSTLGLAYAERHPQRVTELILFSVTMTTPREIDWITRGVGMFFPEAWERFRDGGGETAGVSLVDAYHRLLMDPNPVIHEKAARDWCDWEASIVAVHPGDKPHPRYQDASFRLGFARLVTHYWRHNAWLEDGVLLRVAKRLAGIPGILLHGRLDIGSPLMTAWELRENWEGSELIVVDDAGHGSGYAGIRDAIIAATKKFAAA
jgi:proline iminopeptidase